MAIGTIFQNNRTQAVRLPLETRFSEEIKRVTVRVQGQDRILSPVEHAWDSFFLMAPPVTEDFLEDRGEQVGQVRESL